MIKINPGKNKGRLLLFTLTALLGLSLVAVFLHEAAHTGTALVLGVALDDIKFGFYGFNPAVFIPQGTPVDVLRIIHYAGGLLAGAIGLLAYLFWRRLYRRQPTGTAWLFGMTLAVITGWQIANGIIEGHMHAVYIAWSGNLFTLTNLLSGLGMMEGVLIHRWLNPPQAAARSQEV